MRTCQIHDGRGRVAPLMVAAKLRDSIARVRSLLGPEAPASLEELQAQVAKVAEADHARREADDDQRLDRRQHAEWVWDELCTAALGYAIRGRYPSAREIGLIAGAIR